MVRIISCSDHLGYLQYNRSFLTTTKKVKWKKKKQYYYFIPLLWYVNILKTVYFINGNGFRSYEKEKTSRENISFGAISSLSLPEELNIKWSLHGSGR